MDKAGSYLIFQINEQRFGVDLANVVEVVKAVKLDNLPQAPRVVKGILNYHGELLPVVDLYKVFDFPEREDEASDILIIIETSKRKQSLWVESVIGIVKKEKQNVYDSQLFFLGLETVKGIFKYSDNTIILSDMDKLLTDGEMRKLQKVLRKGKDKD